MAATGRTTGEIDFGRLAERLTPAADPIRLGVLLLLLLGRGEQRRATIRDAIGRDEWLVSKQLGLLRAAGVVEARRDRQQGVYALTAEGRDLPRVVAALVGGG